MSQIIKRPYRLLCDFMDVYQFMVDIYARDWRNGVAAPFFEYAQMLYWTDLSQCHRNAIWEENGRIVAFCFYEEKIGEAFFSLRPGYEDLVPEMLEHAEERLSAEDGSLRLNLLRGQQAVIDTAASRGYHLAKERILGIYDFKKGLLDYPLPDGFSFEIPGKIDMKKLIESSWRGFDHTTEPDGGVERGHHLMTAPHARPDLEVLIKNSDGEYVCYAGMWLVPENHLAYMEPLCTVPECRRMGLASAALSECCRRTAPLGADHMTGGGHPFYAAIGYDPVVNWEFWDRTKE